MNYGSVASGIEAATCAWEQIEGWKPLWFSQYDPEHNYEKGPDFPSAVLQHHYPTIPNLGDMLLLKENKIYNDATIDLLVGGTPCQSFSVAGFRDGIYDQRGNLSLEYCRILYHKKPGWFVWENVPGVLTSGKNADGSLCQGKDFACLLSAFTGRNVAAQKFTRGGIIEGEFYSVAWRVLDAQYFGMAQKRKRLFVIGYFGKNWRPPFAVLFEQESFTRSYKPMRQIKPESIISFRAGKRALEYTELCDTLNAVDYKEPMVLVSDDLVRRFTPVEYERLQGFPDDYTNILYNGAPARNGLRYKVLGNTMNVNVMLWLGRRIDKVDKLLKELKL